MYIVYGHDMDLYFFYGRTDVRRCPTCRHLLRKWEEDLTCVPIKTFRKYDVGGSYDGILVWSSKAKAIYESAGMTGLRFIPLAHPNLYAVRAEPVVQYDSSCQYTRFENQCVTCGNWGFVGIGTPVVLMPGTVVPPLGFARTDLEFASKDEKSPLFICGDEAAKILKSAKLKGLDLEKIKT